MSKIHLKEAHAQQHMYILISFFIPLYVLQSFSDKAFKNTYVSKV